MYNIELREELEKICNSDPNTHKEQIDGIKDKYNHTIKLIRKFSGLPPDIRMANDDCYVDCFMYGFGISFGDIKENAIMPNGSYKFLNKFPNSEFATNLIDNYLEQLTQQETLEGDYVIYFSNNKPKHIGKFLEKKIASKWGGNGHFWEHGIWEVSKRYGDTVKFYKKLPKEEVLMFYTKWIEEKD